MAGFLASLLAACSGWNPAAIQVGQSTSDDLARNLGRVDYEWRDSAGHRVLQFSNLPNGVETWAATLDANGTVIAFEQLLTDAHFEQVARGMSQDEVQRLLGRPISKQTFPLKQQEVWDWPFHSGGQEMRFHVHFDPSGHVVDITSMPLQNGG